MIYLFKNVETGEERDISLPIDAPKEYEGENGKEEWRRVFTTPQVSLGNSTGKINPWDSKSFADRTGNMKGTIGDIETHSKEMSEARASENGGKDPVKEKYFKQYSKERNGAKHPGQLGGTRKSNGVTIEY